MNELLLAVVFGFIFIVIIIYIFNLHRKCKPNCDGAFWGPNSSDGCGGECSCKEGGVPKPNGVCCYPNCNGLYCGDDGCGGNCSCNAIPNGKCQNKRCCYAQEQNYVYCGDDGCGGTRTCHDGSTCSPSGVCAGGGTSGWTYNILKPNGTVQRKNTVNVSDCAGWLPENLKLDLLNFPCKNDTDCPKGDKCVKDLNGNSFCNRNDIYQYWIYDPLDPSGFSCSKILAGSNVCGSPKTGATAFNVLDNHGPDKDACGISCPINPICPPTGVNSCCPKDWVQNGNTSYCSDSGGKTMCCLNNPLYNDYQKCLADGFKSCEAVPNVWWKGNQAEISNSVCGAQITGSNLSINSEALKNTVFTAPCDGKYSSQVCTFDNGSTKYTGVCRSCLDGRLLCLPERMCVANYTASNQGGTCSVGSVC